MNIYLFLFKSFSGKTSGPGKYSYQPIFSDHKVKVLAVSLSKSYRLYV